MDFRWIPHKGIDKDAVERMKQHFPRPMEAPPEAWFISGETNQKYFTELLDVPTIELDQSILEKYLFDTGGGIKNFSRRGDWVTWFQYLLPYLLKRVFEGDLLTHTVTYFLNVYPDAITEEYPGFREDVLLTLPQCIMRNELWNRQDLAKDQWWFDEGQGYWADAFNSSLFFCLKYLSPAEMPGWVNSIANIEGQYWRGQVVEWLKRINKFFYYIEHPERVDEGEVRKANLHEIKEGYLDYYLEIAGVNWWQSILVFSGHHSSKNLYDYMSKENIETFWREVQKYPQLTFTDANL